MHDFPDLEIAATRPAHGVPLRRQRSLGRATIEVARFGKDTRVAHLAESGPCRLRLPRHCGPALEAVLLNTAGGIACGDAVEIAIRVGRSADAVITTPAAERIYKSDGAISRIATDMRVHAGARLDWLPQETILYDRAALSRRLDAEIDPGATATLFEALVFGRAAHGEHLARGEIRDAWRVRRGGRLVFADALRLDGEIGRLLDRPATGGGAGATATLVHIAPDAEARLDEARDLLKSARPGTCGAGAWNGMLVARFLARDSAELRAAAIPLLEGLRGRPLPRVWQS